MSLAELPSLVWRRGQGVGRAAVGQSAVGVMLVMEVLVPGEAVEPENFDNVD